MGQVKRAKSMGEWKAVIGDCAVGKDPTLPGKQQALKSELKQTDGLMLIAEIGQL